MTHVKKEDIRFFYAVILAFVKFLNAYNQKKIKNSVKAIYYMVPIIKFVEAQRNACINSKKLQKKSYNEKNIRFYEIIYSKKTSAKFLGTKLLAT